MITAWTNSHLLSFLVFAPLLWGLALLPLSERQGRLAKLLGLLGSLGVFVVAAIRLLHLPADPLGQVYAERFAWFTAVGIPVDYHLAVDGLNLWLVLLTTFLVPLTLLGTWNSIGKRAGTAVALFLMLETGMLGALVAQDLLVFYLFWEAMLLPMYFLIGVWGGDERSYAATKFVLFTLSGSLLWLVALLFLAGKAGSFAPGVMAQAVAGLPTATQGPLFLAFALAFAIKVPLFPLHTWLPDAHTQAPTGGSVILAGVLLKLGSYGFLRFALPMFPDAAVHFSPLLALLSVVGHRLRGPGGHGADRHQEAGGLLLGEPHGLHHAGHRLHDRAGHPGRHAADAQPRHLHRRAVPAGGHALRPAPTPAGSPTSAAWP